jgi:hypothetical protein
MAITKNRDTPATTIGTAYYRQQNYMILRPFMACRNKWIGICAGAEAKSGLANVMSDQIA